MTTEMLITMVKAWPESLKQNTTVLKDQNGDQTGCELPIHLLVKKTNLTMQMLERGGGGAEERGGGGKGRVKKAARKVRERKERMGRVSKEVGGRRECKEKG